VNECDGLLACTYKKEGKRGRGGGGKGGKKTGGGNRGIRAQPFPFARLKKGGGERGGKMLQGRKTDWLFARSEELGASEEKGKEKKGGKEGYMKRVEGGMMAPVLWLFLR